MTVCVPLLQRAVLVPVLSANGTKVVIAQTRGHDFVDACTKASGSYEVDVFRQDGSKQTDVVHVEGLFYCRHTSNYQESRLFNAMRCTCMQRSALWVIPRGVRSSWSSRPSCQR